MRTTINKAVLVLMFAVYPLCIFAQNNGNTVTDTEHTRHYALEYLADDFDSDRVEDLPSLVERCIKKFNDKRGAIDSNDVLLIDGGIIDAYKRLNKVGKIYPLTVIDLAMLRFVFGSIDKKGIKLSRDELFRESINRIQWDGPRMDYTYFYFEDGFITLMLKKMESLKASNNPNNVGKLEELELEFLQLMLSLWDMSLSEENKKDLIRLTNESPKDLREEILISKIMRLLPQDKKYPRDHKELIDITIKYILSKEPDTRDNVEKRKITEFLVTSGFMLELTDGIKDPNISDEEKNSKTSILSLLSDHVDLGYFDEPENQIEWFLYHDVQEQINKNYQELCETKMIKALETKYNVSYDNIVVLMDLIAKDISDNITSLSKEQKEMLGDEAFYQILQKKIKDMPLGQDRSDAEVILFYLSCLAFNLNSNNNIPLSRGASMSIMRNMNTYVPIYTVALLNYNIEERGINTLNTLPMINRSIQTYKGAGISKGIKK